MKDAAWVRNPIDHFVLAKLEAQGLQAGAARPTSAILIRRATFDLTGLPPTPEEVDAFLRDNSPDAFAKVVDRLLASPRYGERWGRYWLDVARYSDDKLNSTQEEPYPNAFRYRDWVIQRVQRGHAVRHVRQGADRRRPAASPDPLQYLPGLGFYALSPEMQDERVDATTRGFLGLTVACAQCHDHKFDPIPQKDYYSLQGVFSSTRLQQVAARAQGRGGKVGRRKEGDRQAGDEAQGLRRRADATSWAAFWPARPRASCWPRGNWRRRTIWIAETLERWTQVPGEPQEGAPVS